MKFINSWANILSFIMDSVGKGVIKQASSHTVGRSLISTIAAEGNLALKISFLMHILF